MFSNYNTVFRALNIVYFLEIKFVSEPCNENITLYILLLIFQLHSFENEKSYFNGMEIEI